VVGLTVGGGPYRRWWAGMARPIAVSKSSSSGSPTVRATARVVVLTRNVQPPLSGAATVDAVDQACRTYALNAQEPYGIWGALTPSERRRVRASRGLGPLGS